jgi:hypothetical protein
MKKCKVCNCSSESDFCFRHKERKPMPKISKKLQAIRDSPGYKEYTEKMDKMTNFFFLIWQQRPHKSEVSFTDLGKEPLLMFFHHILPKNKYPQAEYDKENIILLTFEEHEAVEADMYKYAEINKRRELLKLKYNL